MNTDIESRLRSIGFTTDDIKQMQMKGVNFDVLSAQTDMTLKSILKQIVNSDLSARKGWSSTSSLFHIDGRGVDSHARGESDFSDLLDPS